MMTVPVICDRHNREMARTEATMDWHCPEDGCTSYLADEDVQRLISGCRITVPEIRVT